MILEIFLLLGLGVGAWQDLKSRIISNVLSFGLFACLLALILIFPTDAYITHFGGFLLSFCIFMPLFYKGLFGGGDVKLLLSIGLVFGLYHFLEVLVFITCIGALQAIWYKKTNPKDQHLPYAVALFLGSSLYIAFKTFA